MPGKAVGRVAAGLPWLCPNTNSLICLAEAPAGLARPFAAGPDVGLLAFLLRHTPLTAAPPSPLFSEQALTAAVLPETAAAYLSETAVGWVDSASAAATACRPFATLGAAFARRLAAHTNRGCPERAAVLVALAPLGWLAVAAADALAADAVLNDPDVSPTAAVQAAAWGFDQNAITRRLAHRWRLPDWAATALGSFALSLGAVRLVASDVSLFVLAQFAVLETERRTRTLGLTESADRAELLRELRITDPTVEELWQASGADAEARPTAVPTLDQNPRAAPLLANLLRLAGESRRRNGAALVLRLEDRMDSLHAAVKRAAADAEIRARDAKLTALAELAAGAGHEINNPLAIISGHAQRLARTEPDPERGEALQSVIRQANRIAGIVRDLMQFARPPRPDPHRVAAAELAAAVGDELAALATEKGARIDITPVPTDVYVWCDRNQVKNALAALVRNGIEAAGRDGWVRLSAAACDDDTVAFGVEDSGPGLNETALEHAFDPFFCGRPAGRGRGLGLPTAWQLARQNGGDVRHEPAGGATRFTVIVPRSITLEFRDRQSA